MLCDCVAYKPQLLLDVRVMNKDESFCIKVLQEARIERNKLNGLMLAMSIKGRNIVICRPGTLKVKVINLATKRFTFFVLYEALCRIAKIQLPPLLAY